MVARRITNVGTIYVDSRYAHRLNHCKFRLFGSTVLVKKPIYQKFDFPWITLTELFGPVIGKSVSVDTGLRMLH